MSRFTSTKAINSRWRNNDFVGVAGSSHTFPDAFHDEFLVDWATQIADGSIVITETPTTGNIEMANLTVGNITLTGTATGFSGGSTIVGTSPIGVVTASGTSTISLNANYQTAGTYVTSVAGTAPITSSGTTAITVGIDQTTITANSATNALVLRQYVKNDSGSALSKGQAVYITGANGTNVLIGLAAASSEINSSKTFGLLAQDLAINDSGYVIQNGLLTGIDTSSATSGSSVWLSNTPGGVVYNSPPAEPAHSVYLGVVSRSNLNNGEILVKVQNGYEIDELHNVSATNPSDGDIIQYKTSSSLWTKSSIGNAGIASSTHTHAYQPSGTYVTSVSGTSPISTTGTTAITVSVADATATTKGVVYVLETVDNSVGPYTVSSNAVVQYAAGLTSTYVPVSYFTRAFFGAGSTYATHSQEALTTTNTNTSGTLVLTRLYTNATIRNIAVASGATASSGLTYCAFGVYTRSGTTFTRQRQTSSDTTIFNTANTKYTRALTASLTTSATTEYWIGVLQVGTTMATTLGATARASDAANAATGVQVYTATGQTTLPSTVTGTAHSTRADYAEIS